MNFSSIKEIKKAIKKQAAETVQNSKVFKMKNKIERINIPIGYTQNVFVH